MKNKKICFLCGIVLLLLILTQVFCYYTLPVAPQSVKDFFDAKEKETNNAIQEYELQRIQDTAEPYNCFNLVKTSFNNDVVQIVFQHINGYLIETNYIYTVCVDIQSIENMQVCVHTIRKYDINNYELLQTLQIPYENNLTLKYVKDKYAVFEYYDGTTQSLYPAIVCYYYEDGSINRITPFENENGIKYEFHALYTTPNDLYYSYEIWQYEIGNIQPIENMGTWWYNFESKKHVKISNKLFDSICQYGDTYVFGLEGKKIFRVNIENPPYKDVRTRYK